MNTTIEQPVYYTVTFIRQLRHTKQRSHIGSFSDIRDAIQAIVTTYKRTPNFNGEFTIGTTTTKPRSWLYPTKYQDNRV
jgi:nucleoside-diphosphate-sugar epimerase